MNRNKGEHLLYPAQQLVWQSVGISCQFGLIPYWVGSRAEKTHYFRKQYGELSHRWVIKV